MRLLQRLKEESWKEVLDSCGVLTFKALRNQKTLYLPHQEYEVKDILVDGETLSGWNQSNSVVLLRTPLKENSVVSIYGIGETHE